MAQLGFIFFYHLKYHQRLCYQELMGSNPFRRWISFLFSFYIFNNASLDQITQRDCSWTCGMYHETNKLFNLDLLLYLATSILYSLVQAKPCLHMLREGVLS